MIVLKEFDGIAESVTELGHLLVQIIMVKLAQENNINKKFGIVKDALSVKDYFAAYPYIVELRWRRDVDFVVLLAEIEQWCGESEITEFANSILRVNKLNQYLNGGDSNEYVMDSGAGRDIWFWAFTDEKDALMFSLRW